MYRDVVMRLAHSFPKCSCQRLALFSSVVNLCNYKNHLAPVSCIFLFVSSWRDRWPCLGQAHLSVYDYVYGPQDGEKA